MEITIRVIGSMAHNQLIRFFMFCVVHYGKYKTKVYNITEAMTPRNCFGKTSKLLLYYRKTLFCMDILILKRISDCKCIFMTMHYGKSYLNYWARYVISFNYTSYNVLHKIITRLHKYFTQRQCANKHDSRSNLYFAKLLSSVWVLLKIAVNTNTSKLNFIGETLVFSMKSLYRDLKIQAIYIFLSGLVFNHT